jgi:hypothetical protein
MTIQRNQRYTRQRTKTNKAKNTTKETKKRSNMDLAKNQW